MVKNWCKEHQQIWFKKGAMKGFAHPIKDDEGVTTSWCNRPQDYEEPEEELPKTVKEKEGAVIESIRDKPDGKNRAFALSYAKDIAVAEITKGKEITSKTIIDLAKKFNTYLEIGE